jgi:hypothetical protein
MKQHAKVAVLVLGSVVGSAALATPSERPEVLLNQATAQDIQRLSGASSEVAEEIIAFRTSRGRVSSVEELRALPSVTPEMLNGLRKHVSVQVLLPVGMNGNDPALSASKVLASYSHEPSIQQVQMWATDYAKASPHLVERWLKASKTFASLPQLTLEYRYRDGWDQDFVYLTDAGGAALTPEEDVTPQFSDGGQDQDAYYTVRMRWDLNELVMSSERIRVINEAQDLSKLRDKLLEDVTERYFERRRLQVEMKLAPRQDVMGQVRDQIALMELTAHLDAYTGGAFSAALARIEGAGKEL